VNGVVHLAERPHPVVAEAHAHPAEDRTVADAAGDRNGDEELLAEQRLGHFGEDLVVLPPERNQPLDPAGVFQDDGERGLPGFLARLWGGRLRRLGGRWCGGRRVGLRRLRLRRLVGPRDAESHGCREAVHRQQQSPNRPIQSRHATLRECPKTVDAREPRSVPSPTEADQFPARRRRDDRVVGG